MEDSLSTWVVNPNKVPAFDSDAQLQLVETLAKLRIKVIYDKNLNGVITALPTFPQHLTLLVKGKDVNVYLITQGPEELHIGLVVKDMLALKGKHLQEFRTMFQHVVHTFQLLGYGDYLSFCNFGKKYFSTSQKTIDGHCWEMIPLGKGYLSNKNGPYALAPKIERNNYVLSNKIASLKKPNPSLVAEFVKILCSRMAYDTPNAPFFDEETLPWEFHITDLDLAKDAIINRILEALHALGAVHVLPSSNAGKISKKELESAFNVNLLKRRETCAFCNQEIIKKQEMVRGKNIVVLYTKDGHFLVTPLEHYESLHALPEDEFEEAIQWAQNTSLALGNTNLVWFCQNGPRAGQTVPHTHIHIVHPLNPILVPLKILSVLTASILKHVEEQEYQANRTWILKRLKSLGL